MPKGNWKRWTPKELAELRTFYLSGLSAEVIAKKLSRSVHSIENKIQKKGWKIKTKPCESCGVDIEIKGSIKRCKSCSEERTRKKKKKSAAARYMKNRKDFIEKRENKRFGGNREKAIKRDKETCQDCGTTRKDHFSIYGIDIGVYRLDGSTRKNPNNELSNLITLCSSCMGSRYHDKRTSDYSGVSEHLKEFWNRQRELKELTTYQKLDMGLRPVKRGEVTVWQ